ncbi:hypothetical protein K505DRAFT_412423 [Melanomma pulvis-pyrius CBS 109.77]|uniref:Uncharacterized protein n=1 Tax=Melanomma pulvis-pyrius CBS 109.77 TaxID=1314802 RepID=A0A6A6XZG9_9PLEO|nr:hypothetical protein K505DRAFT_412423 [Melanomma pulvis-pyrius CBS 109.77]
MLVPLLLATAALAAAQNTEPCAEVASLLDSSSYYIPAQVAFQCLQSVPVDVEGNKILIDELKIAWQWNSEVGYLKNTPDDWELGPVDIEAELDKIKENLSNYASEYEVQRAIQDIVTKTGNYHFNYRPDIIQVFDFKRRVGVVSISEDGKKLPKLYVENDAFNLDIGSVSEIAKINDEEAYEYLQKIAKWGQYVDADGRLNKLFSKGDTYALGTFESQIHYDGASTNITFANGTTATYANVASSQESFTGVTDGPSFFEAFCTGALSSTFSATAAGDVVDLQGEPRFLNGKSQIPKAYHLRKRQTSKTSAISVVEADSGAVSGYFLQGAGYENVAVLKILNFSPDGDESGNEFQATIKKFLEECIEAKKEKLIIDLRENGGGAPSLVLDAFMQLFPDQVPFSAQRYRAEEQWTAIGDAISEIHNSPTLSAAYERRVSYRFDEAWRYWAYWHFVTAKGENFADWKAFVGPEEFNGDSYTAVSRYNYSNSDRISILVDDFYFLNTTGRPTPFKAENIVMFTDALCGSACAGLHEELKNIAGVKSVTVGGRPENKPIQAVTGSKGSEVHRVGTLPEFGSAILSITSRIGAKVPTSPKLQQLANITQLIVRAGDSHTRIQTQDQLRKGDTTGTPLEFIYEAADCRIFYTGSTWWDPNLAWKAAWDAFVDDTKCVEGSTGHKSSISGGFKPFGPGDLDDANLAKPNQTTEGPGPSGTAASGTPSPKGAGARLSVGGGALVVGVVAAFAMW